MDNSTANNSSFSNSKQMTTPEPPLYIMITASFLYVVIFVVGIVGNILVIVVVSRVKPLRSRMTYLFLNLSVADLLILVVCLPSAAVDLYAKEVWYFGAFLCSFIPFLESTVALTSVLTILAVSYDRYRGICHPMVAENYWQSVKVAYIIIMTWLIAGTAGVPLLFMARFKSSKFVDGTDIEVCRIPVNETWKVVYIMAIFVVFFILTSFVLIFLIGKMCQSLLQNMSLLVDAVNTEMKKKIYNRKRVVIMLILVATLFFVCLLPQRIVSIWIIFADRRDLIQLGFEGYLNLLTFTRVAMFLNSSINPIIYNTLSAKFKIALRCLLCGEDFNDINDLLPMSRRCSSANQNHITRQLTETADMVTTPPTATGNHVRAVRALAMYRDRSDTVSSTDDNGRCPLDSITKYDSNHSILSMAD
ncbi:hypothetical protein FSP39_013284 [Pinctada imbricata]|uniref:G-protein coupled receptors family 1 profile domain-containing protein n=1 Tax=Pinctada imbricata TaxID=66713 RepID=A0AA88YGW7_PINIB|nr:hypothetical protein FSP39_013284 [Pinctada imbricata]